MKSLVLQEVGKPVVLIERPVPEPNSDELLVKVTVAGLNPHDREVRDNGLLLNGGGLPFVLGADTVGTVEKVGSAVTKFQVGDRVFGQVNLGKLDADQGALQEYNILHQDSGAKVPERMTDDDAATLPTNIVAAYFQLFADLNIPQPVSGLDQNFDYKSQKLVVIGAGTNCGKFEVQLASLAGIGTIVAVAAKRNEAELKGFGATHVVDRHANDLEGEIRAIVGDDLIYATDAVNQGQGHTLGVSILSNSKKGTLVTLVPGKADETKVGPKSAGWEEKYTEGLTLWNLAVGTPMWDHLPTWLEQGKIKPLKYSVIDGLDGDKVNEVLDAYRDGKPVMQPHVHP